MSFEKTYNLRANYLQVQSLNPFAFGVTGSRAAMFASEIGQAPPISNCEVKLIQSGMEREYGKYTAMVKMPVNGIVKRVYQHYSAGMTYGTKASQPTTIIYQDDSSITDPHTKRSIPLYGMVHIPTFVHNHHVLGFDYVRTPTGRNLTSDLAIPAGTVLAHSPSLTKPGGEYRYGVNANLCFISLPEVRQDGVIMSESFSNKTKFKGYEEVILGFDGEDIPLNLYGTDGEYKIFPDVGERIREDGVIFATRKLISGLYPVQTSRKALKETTTTDKIFRFKGDGSNARVISVEVFYSSEAASRDTRVPEGMVRQCQHYLNVQRHAAQDIYDFYKELNRMHGRDGFQLTPELQNLMTNNLYLVSGNQVRRGKKPPLLVDNTVPLKEYTVKITYSYDINPIAAYKMADGNGGKGVFVIVWPDDRMPVDKYGTRADICMDGGSLIGRSNLARVYEQTINNIFWLIRHNLRQSLDADPSEANRYRWWEQLHHAYSIISPRFAAVVATKDKLNHVKACYDNDIVIWMPTDNPVKLDDAILELQKYFPTTKDYLELTRPDGSKVLSKEKGIIGKQYIMILDKTGEEYSAVSTPVLQHQGIPGKLSKVDKQSSPGRPQATRITGETEGRILNTLAHYDALFTLLDIANSPTTQRAVTRTLLTHETPTNIDKIIDRNLYPRHNNRIVNIVRTSFLVAGFQFTYKPISGD